MNRDGKVAKGAGEPEDLLEHNCVSRLRVPGWTQDGLRIKREIPGLITQPGDFLYKG